MKSISNCCYFSALHNDPYFLLVICTSRNYYSIFILSPCYFSELLFYFYFRSLLFVTSLHFSQPPSRGNEVYFLCSCTSHQGQTIRQTARSRNGPFSHYQLGRIDINTVNPSLLTGKDFLIHSLWKY